MNNGNISRSRTMNTVRRFVTPAMRLVWLAGLFGPGLLASWAQTTHYVAPNGPGPAPYTNWATAASNIQDALDQAIALDTVLVSNGTYNLTNQVIIASNQTVRSLNGAAVTFVNGNNYAGKPVTNRCFYMSAGVLDGFTISNGLALNDYGGGVFMTNAGTLLQNCTLSACLATNTAANAMGGAVYMSDGMVSNCLIAGNRANGTKVGWPFVAGDGGGIYINSAGWVVNCLFTNNRACMGGGVYGYYGGTVSNCTFLNNVAGIGGDYSAGGGIYQSFWGAQAKGCLFRGNSALVGGGGAAYCSSLVNCQFIGNSAIWWGGGFYEDGGGNVMQNCLFISNSATYGGGVHFRYGGTMDNTTVSGNSAAGGGGVSVGNAKCILTNSIVYFNTASSYGPNCSSNDIFFGADTSFTNIYSCTTPRPEVGMGPGGTTNDPRFINLAAGNSRLNRNAGSSCINTGTNKSWMTNALDLDGNRRIFQERVDMGAYESPPFSGTIFTAH